MNAVVHDDTNCDLGEGPLWHPIREQLLWFDITNKALMTRNGAKKQTWHFDEMVSAAGWVSASELLIASESRLFVFDVDSGEDRFIADLEADLSSNRSNDGRADPWGGFWIGTMGKSSEHSAGSIYRYYRGAVERMFSDLTIPNAICFAPDQSYAYFTDTATQTIMRQALEPQDGWPTGAREAFIDLASEGLNPDGAVTDRDGNLWIALWGASRVACYGPDGAFKSSVSLPAAHVTCPAFGGSGLNSLYCTSARQGIATSELNGNASHGQTFRLDNLGPGRPEYQVIL